MVQTEGVTTFMHACTGAHFLKGVAHFTSLPPTNWPRQKAPIIIGKLINCHPSPEKMRQAMTRGTGRWMARIHGRENLRTRLRQMPKGKFRTNTIAATIHNVIRSV